MSSLIDSTSSPLEGYEVAPAFTRYARATWPDAHAERIVTLQDFERGARALGLNAEHLAIGMSYWLAITQDHPERAWREGMSSELHAAALFIAVELQHTEEPVSPEAAGAAFGVDITEIERLEGLVEALEPLVARIPVKQAITHLREVHTFEREREAALAEQRFEKLWQSPPDTRAIKPLPLADFGMILEIIPVDDVMASSLPYTNTPTHLLLASSDRHDEPLATIPWFDGQMSPAQRAVALRTLLCVASLRPDGLQGARPLILFLPEQSDVDALLSSPGLEGMAMATHAALATHMANHTSDLAGSSAAGQGSTRKRKAQRATRKKQRRRARKGK